VTGARNLYLTGEFEGTVDFDPGSNTYNLVSAGGSDIFFAKLNQDGKFLWCHSFGATMGDWGDAIVVDNTGYVYASGVFNGKVDFAPGADTMYLVSYGYNNFGSRNAYISKWDTSGNFVWVKGFGGKEEETAGGMFIDENLDLFTTGKFADSADFHTEDYYDFRKSRGTFDVYIHKISQCITSSADQKISACYSYRSPSGKYLWTGTGTYYDTIPNYRGCDSLLKINLRISTRSASTIFKKSCALLVSPSGKYTWTTSGTYKDTIRNVYGCDSIMSVAVTISLNSSSTISMDACKAIRSPSGKYTWNTAGTYRDTIKNKKGCDSFMTLNINFIQASSAYINIQSCGQYVSPSRKYTWSTNGIYLDTITNHVGCDSILTINLALHQSSSANVSMSACNSIISPSGKYTWTYSGTYIDTVLNKQGCDSIISIKLKVLRNSNTNRIVTACGSYTSPSGKYVWINSGTHVDTIPNASGCDSLISIDLTLRKNATVNNPARICDGEAYKIGKHSYTVQGDYRDTFRSHNGCDSIILTKLEIKSAIDVTTSLTGQTITANIPGASYQWLDCGNKHLPVLNARNRSYSAVKNGNYAVQVFKDDCYDTSDCVNINSIGISGFMNQEGIFTLYPNPNNGVFTFTLHEDALIMICNLLGEQIETRFHDRGDKIFEMKSLPAGVYYIIAVSGNGTQTVKWIKF
jgi:hypothetical protein